MAGLGAQLDPSGESGTVDTPVISQTDVVQNDKGQIRQTTSVESISHVMFRDWIYSRTYTIDTSMKPGHVFGLIRIHPFDCNPYVNYISRMFKTWTGGMKVRARFMANFANGGSFRIGYMPPIYTQDDVYRMPLSTLTGYPNQDLDPKNTDWTEFRTSDQRNVAYHYTVDPNSTDDPMSFGGWIVFYVVGSLVQTLQSSGNVQMVIETAGDFDFRQLSPLSMDTDVGGPLPSHALAAIIGVGGCDDPDTTIDSLLVQPPTNDGLIRQGWIKARQINGAHIAVEGMKISSLGAQMRSSNIKSGSLIARLDAEGTVVNNQMQVGYGSIFRPAANGTVLSLTGRTNGDSTFYNYDNNANNGNNLRFVDPVAPGALPCTTLGVYFKPARQGNVTQDLWHGECTISNKYPSESIVYFVNSKTGGVNIQTSIMADALLSNPATYSNTTYMYSLRDNTDLGPLLYLRLSPDGVFTTRAVESPAAFSGKNYFLRFEQELSPTSPLPPQPNQFMLFKAMQVTRKALKHGLLIDEAYRRYGAS